MANPDFPLASWEVPPDSNVPLVAPADHVFSAWWRGCETEIWVRQIETLDGMRTYFRDSKSDEIGNWLTGSDGFSAQSFQQTLGKDGPWSYDPNARRQFYLDGAPYGHPGPIELRIGRKQGSWRLGKQITYFELPAWTTEDFVSRSPARLERMATSWLRQNDSEIRFALGWTQLSTLQKKARILGISDEEMEDIETLMYYAFQIYLHNNSDKMRDVTVADWEINFTVKRESIGGISHNNGEFHDPVPASLQGWREMLWRYFEVNFDETLSQWARTASYTRCHSIYVWTKRVSNFSAHEKLEAQLILHKWCKQAGRLEQFEALLAQ